MFICNLVSLKVMNICLFTEKAPNVLYAGVTLHFCQSHKAKYKSPVIHGLKITDEITKMQKSVQNFWFMRFFVQQNSIMW